MKNTEHKPDENLNANELTDLCEHIRELYLNGQRAEAMRLLKSVSAEKIWAEAYGHPLPANLPAEWEPVKMPNSLGHYCTHSDWD